MRNAPAVRVKQGNRVQLDGTNVRVQGEGSFQGMEVYVAMRQHNAFGIGARAAGIKQLGKRVFVEVRDFGSKRFGERNKRIVIVGGKPGRLRARVQQMERFDCGKILAEGVNRRGEAALQQKHSRASVVEDVGKLAGREADVQGQQDGASLENAIVGFKQTVAVSAKER